MRFRFAQSDQSIAALFDLDAQNAFKTEYYINEKRENFWVKTSRKDRKFNGFVNVNSQNWDS